MVVVDSLIMQADEALARNELFEARRLLAAAIENAPPNVDLWLKCAAVCRAQADLGAALEATDQALTLDPLHALGLLLRANLLDRLGRPEADRAYGHALAQGLAGLEGAVPRELLTHAAQRNAAYQMHLDDQLASIIAEASIPLTDNEASRVARCRTNATRLTRVYHSDPTDYHYPGLAEREFHERECFEWLATLEAATDDIAADLTRVVAAEQAEIIPYIQYQAGQPLRQWAALNHSRDWTAIHLMRNGAPITENVRHCPATMAAIANMPLPNIPGASPNAMFSLLAPHTHIPPHTGIANTRLVCHLPLIVPEKCWFRVGAEQRAWQRGEAWVFDDTIEHEAKNESDALRVILIVDVWHPDLNERERSAISTLVQAHGRLDDPSRLGGYQVCSGLT